MRRSDSPRMARHSNPEHRGDTIVHLVAHTHWDREWYHPAGRFRQRLAALIDELLDDDEPRTPFLLDGQAVVLDDYAALRPGRTEEIARALRDGSIEAGPWYVLADELIPSGEALVRNLLAGRRVLRRFDAEAPPVLYSPDAFGHTSALPLLARGFGCELAVVWRGYGGSRWPSGDTARWQSRDGTSVILFHLPPDGYEFGSSLPADAEGARARWRAVYGTLGPRSRTGIMLLQNGADHHARQAGFDHAIDALSAAAAPIAIERSTLRRFASALLDRARAISLPTVQGELRYSYGYTCSLQGTLATRARQKRRNATVERLLVRDTEPWAALAARARGTPRRHLTSAAWLSVLLSHPHDTLCGCSIDEVARAMDARLDDAFTQASGIRDDAVLDLIGHDVVDARTRKADWRSLMLVRNRAPRTRGGIAELEIETFLADVPVGPGSRPPERVRQVVSPRVLHGDVPMQLLATRRTNRRTESPRHYPDNDLVEVRRVVAWLPPVAGYAITPLPVDDGRGGAPLTDAVVSATSESLDNGNLRVTLEADSSITLAASDGRWSMPRVIAIENVGDRGDLYTHSPFGPVRIDDRFLRARIIHAGPLRGELETRWRMVVPSAADRRRAGARPETRGAGFVDVRIRLSMDAASPFVRVIVDGVNGATAHRLRVRFATGIVSPRVSADAAFGPVERHRIEVSEAERGIETPPPTAPLHRYVSVFGRDRGLTVYSDGLAEYEATQEGVVGVTLVRAVGDLSRNDLPERPGHAGWPVATPEAQMLGPFAGEFALFPHGGPSAETRDLIERTADDVLLPLIGTTLRSAVANYAPTPPLELEGRGLAFSAAKESEDGEWLVLRCVNVTDKPTDGRWILPFTPREARHARLDETPEQTLTPAGRALPFAAGGGAVVTILVR
ncbi:MAG: glycoside hydrolase family 38 [Geminicoccaceae bacterium]|nr:glycoside hydrolase family 38 [Geminicoccaceae bacterium]